MGIEERQWLHPKHIVSFDEWELADFAVFGSCMLMIGYILMRKIANDEKKLKAARCKNQRF